MAQPNPSSHGDRGSAIRMLLFVPLLLAAPFGCASSRPQATIHVDPGNYTQTFDAARRVLRSHRFDLERVDAAAGVITTAPKESAGLASPWDLDQTYFSQDLADTLNHQRRRVRITFPLATEQAMQTELAPQTEPALQTNPAPQLAQAARIARVEVFVDRVQSPGLRIPARAPTLWSVTTDPAQSARGVSYQYDTTRTRDPALERRLADEIERAARPAI